MKQTTRYFMAALLAMNIFLLASVLWRPAPAVGRETLAGKAFSSGARFTVSIGLNDKDARRQLLTATEAKARLNGIAAGHVGGFTVHHAEGYWTDASGAAASEETLVYTFLETTDAQMAAMAAQMKAALNQESILVEKNGVSYVFF